MSYEPGKDAYDIAIEYRKKFNNASLDFIRKNHKEKAIKHLVLAAKAGYLDAMFDLAILYSNDMRLSEEEFTFSNFSYSYFSENKQKALEWLISCGERNHKKAMHLLMDYYSNIHYGCEHNPDKVIYWMEKAYFNGESNLFDPLIKNYYFNRENYFKKGIELLEKHLPKNNLDTWEYTKMLAEFYRLANRIEDAVPLYKLICEKEPDASYQLGFYYEKKEDYTNAVHYYKLNKNYARLKAFAKKGLEITPKEYFELVSKYSKIDETLCYATGFGTQKDEIKAFPALLEYYNEQTKRWKGYPYVYTLNAEILTTLGDCYYYGKGTNVNLSRALELFLLAEKREDYKEHNRDYAIAWCAYYTKDYKKSFPRLLEVSKKYGTRTLWVYRLLGHSYLYGYGCNKNPKEAFKQYELGAKENDAPCANSVGYCYLNGYGIEKNTVQAYYWFTKSYELEKSNYAAYNIGYCYEMGYGCTKDIEKAYEWYTISANDNYELAKKKVEELKPQVRAIQKEKNIKKEQEKIEDLTKQIVEKIEKLKTGNTSSVKTTISDAPVGSAKERLNELIGLDSVKKEIQELENFIKVMNLRKARGLPVSDISKHMVFTGNPGTGKTTVARIVAEIYKENGILEKGHLVETDRDGLVGRYIGETGKKTRAIIESAMGGVLFIDEAYSLIPKDSDRDFGPEAVATLLKMMEDYKNDLVVIVAGYKDEMEFFIDSNPGLKSRFTSYIDFPDYTPEEMQQMFELRAASEMFIISESAKAKLLTLWATSSKYENLGNGRCVRNVFEKTKRLQSNRIIEQDLSNDQDLDTILAEDIPNPEDIFH